LVGPVLEALLQQLEDVGEDEGDGKEGVVGVAVVHRGHEDEQVDQDGRDAKRGETEVRGDQCYDYYLG
jgi:hypothetical protein